MKTMAQIEGEYKDELNPYSHSEKLPQPAFRNPHSKPVSLHRYNFIYV